MLYLACKSATKYILSHELLYAEKAFVQVPVIAWIGRRLDNVGHYYRV